MPRSTHIESVFLNIPYDDAFENLYLAYIVGLTQLGLRINATLAIPNHGRLEMIMDLIEQSNFSIHDLSRIELSRGIPRFVNAIDPQIHGGTVKGLMAGLRNIFRQPRDVTTVPEMLASYQAVKRKLPKLRKNAGDQSLFGASLFQDLTLAALIESQKLIENRAGRRLRSQ